MTIENGTAIVLAYVLVSVCVIIAFLLATFVIGWLVGCASAAANRAEKSNLTGSRGALVANPADKPPAQ
jgi:hypothetical protein